MRFRVNIALMPRLCLDISILLEEEERRARMRLKINASADVNAREPTSRPAIASLVRLLITIPWVI